MLQVRARGKVNWTLDVLGQLPNGYHDLDMLLSSVTLCDLLEFRESEELTLTVNSAGQSFAPADDKNLVLRAARLLREETGVKVGADIKLKKYIPVCAGMGGGSSDAAATLLALNMMWKFGLTPDELSSLGLRIGADVPFCLKGGLCRVKGIGETVMPLRMGKPVHLVAIQPCRGLSTKEVFDGLHTEGIAEEDRPDSDLAASALETGDIRTLSRAMGNVLQPVSIRKRPRLRQAIQALRDSGAMAAQMTGSGSVVYGIYPNAQKCREAMIALQMQYPSARAMLTADSGVEIVEAET